MLFAALRPDKGQVPCVPVATVIMGFLVIGQFRKGRAVLPAVVWQTVLDTLFAFIAAVVVVVVYPDRAGQAAREMVATEMQELAVCISQIGTHAFADGKSMSKKKQETSQVSIFIERGFGTITDLFPKDYIFNTENLDRSDSKDSNSGEDAFDRTLSMRKNAETSLQFMKALLPLGWTRADSYLQLASARKLFMYAHHEPCIHHTHDPRNWVELIDALTELVTKVSSLQSVACDPTHGNAARFSLKALVKLFGEQYLPLWKLHYAACAAACANMSARVKDHHYLEAEINGVEWRRRRAEMLYGFLVRYGQCAKPLPGVTTSPVEEMQADEICQSDYPQKGLVKAHTKPIFALLELQALSFFGVATHALAEEIVHVQTKLRQVSTSSRTLWLMILYRIVFGGLSPLFERLKVVLTGKMEGWEVRFAMSHSILCLFILALSLFVPFPKWMEPSEIAWVFTSAVLAAQLSAEPTLFIGAIRVVATVTGALVSYGFTAILTAAGRDTNPTLQYLAVPYILVFTMIVLLLVPPKLRYAAFLLLVTSCVMLFCQRSSLKCESGDDLRWCYPNWQYAISRSVYVSAGVVLAFLFHIIFWPRFANREALQILSTGLVNATRTMGKIRRTYFSYGVDKDEWVKEHQELKEESFYAEMIPAARTTEDEMDVYRKDEMVMQTVRENLSNLVSQAILTVTAEAAVWRVGPMRLSRLFPGLINEFIALDISVSELAALLGRRPIFSPTYGRRVYNHYIKPTLGLYETIQVSLNNLVSATHRMLVQGNEQALRDDVFDLYQAIFHLARMRFELREAAASRWRLFEQERIPAVMVKERLEEWSELGLLRTSTVVGSNVPAVSDNGELAGVCVDDVVFYNTFSFIADGCLSAFVRIAITVVMHAERRLTKKQKKQDVKESE